LKTASQFPKRCLFITSNTIALVGLCKFKDSSLAGCWKKTLLLLLLLLLGVWNDFKF
jgi:hypothetical protein